MLQSGAGAVRTKGEKEKNSKKRVVGVDASRNE